uniref:Uncharacterized protein n=1 Tax=Rhizophora mucronata TaxID=61149 RepID=A0A2P2Q3E4_RHIMU
MPPPASTIVEQITSQDQKS